MTRTNSAYSALETRFARWTHLNGAMAMLGWDREVMMPEGGNDGRSEQMATLAVIAHETLTDPALEDLIGAAEGESLGDWQKANLAEMRRQRIHATAVPADLVAAFARATAKCQMAWRRAKPENDFKSLLPSLQEVLNLTIETAKAKAPALGVSPYDALLDQYEPGGRSERIDALFADLAEFLPGFLAEALEAQARRPQPLPLAGPFEVPAQKAVGEALMRAVGFDFNHGRLDISLHPFCGGVPDDIRLTTRYDTADFTRSLMGVLHETGHAMYERGLPAEWRSQPVGLARGMALHESQSLLIEMQASRSREVIGYMAPLLREAFLADGPAWEAENLYRVYTTVKPDFIRVDADEVTYPSHVILRYRLERAMVDGQLALADLPGAWNDGMKSLLGIVPPTDTLGCMQDIHWMDGGWGYFPTYTMGALAAAQLFDAANRADPSIRPGLARGDFAPLMAWLRANVHSKASSATTDEILTAATGRPLGTEVFKAHLRRRYLEG
ncbi:MAG TPA: carboxypeptidase M32 [Alphaproteobacteria bacterium]|nr:carboxypeptidase M32 [Alphaproteobacteria bacterium]